MSASASHGNLDESLQGIHRPYQGSFVDAAARIAATGFPGQGAFSADDVGKLARQLDDDTLWMLLTIAPTWKQIGASTIAASAVTNTPAGNISSTDVQAALNELDSEKATTGSVSAEAATRAADDATLATAISDHLTDPTTAHAASAISNTPAGGIAATTVQAAIDELDSEKAAVAEPIAAAHIADTSAAHAASAISNTPAGNISATDVQAAINELDTEKASVGGGAGGAGPEGAKYIVSAAHADLSAEIVIPGLAGSPDIASAGGVGTSEEYDTGTTGLTWNPSDPATVNSNTDAKSHLHVQSTDNVVRLGSKSWSPGSGAFDVRAKVSLGPQTNSVFCAIALIVTDTATVDSGAGAMVRLSMEPGSAFYQILAYTLSAGSYTQRGSGWQNMRPSIYLRIARDGSNNISFYFSDDGLAWQLIATQSHTVTVSKVGFRIGPASTATFDMFVDWLRTSV